MNHTLTLLIPDDWPQQRRDCPWLLRAADGSIVARGCSEPVHWPGVGSGDGEPRPCHVLLGGRQVAGHATLLPANRLTQEVAAAALEEQLLEAPERLLFAIRPAAGDGPCSVGVIASQRLESLLAVLRELGLAVCSAWPLGLALQPGTSVLLGEDLTVAWPERGFVTLPLATDAETWLGALLVSEEALPVFLADEPTPALRRLLEQDESRLHCPAAAEPPLAPAGHGFLVGALAPPPRRQALFRPFLPAARLAAGLALAWLLLATAQWTWHAWQGRSYRQEIAASFRQILPQTAMVDPVLQLQRQVNDLRRASGLLADDDFLRLAAAIGTLPAGSIEIHEMQYADGRLALQARLAEAGRSHLLAAAAQQGLRLSFDEGAGAASTRVQIMAGDGR